MRTHYVAFVALVLLSSLAGCGGDDDSSPGDAGADSGSEGGAGGRAGTGGKGGKGGSGGSGGRAQGGSGGEEAGSGGEHTGEGGKGGSGGEGGDGSATKYSVGGSVTGLMGSGLVLKNNGGSELTVNENGDFTFDGELDDGAEYAVTVGTQPTNPTQNCAVAAGSGTIDKANITNVSVTCSTVSHTVGGTLTGVADGTVVIKNNGNDTLSLTADGPFTFNTHVNPGGAYAVTVDTQPSGRSCGVDHGSGTVGSNDVSDVSVTCYVDLALAALPRVRSVGLTWNNNGASSYTAYVSSDANCNFDNVGSCADGAQQANATSPYVWSGLTDGKAYYFQVRGAHAGGLVTHSNTTGARPNRAQFDGPVLATALGSGGTVYVGGRFTHIGPYGGTAVPLDKTTGLPSRIPNFPILNSGVSAIVSDGSNGYFLAGAFTEIGGVTRNHLAHVAANGSVDMTWDPDVDGTVSALVLSGTTLYVGGSFAHVNAGTVARANLAAVSASGTGAATSWDPSASAAVSQLAASADTLYVGGDFTTIGATPRTSLAAFALTGGALKTDWHPDPDGGITGLQVSGGVVYVSGYFGTIGGQGRFSVAGLDPSTGAPNAFQPDPNQPVVALAVSGSVAYIAGDFTSAGGQTRSGLAAVDTATGNAATGWNPAPDDSVFAIAVAGDTVYVGGQFAMVGGAARPGLAALSSATGMASAWNPRPTGPVTVLNVSGDTIYIAGDLTMVGAEPRSRLASFTNDVLSTWAPEAKDGDVFALAVSGTTVYAGGNFDGLGSATRHSLAAIDGNGAATVWDAQLNDTGEVYALAVDNDHVYVGGAFNAAGGGSRSNLAALNTTNGNAASGWNPPSPDVAVHALALGGSTLYLGGEFLNLGANGRSRLAAIDNTGALTNWDPGADGPVDALIVADDDSDVYVGGEFNTLGGATRHALGAINAAGALVAGFDPDLDDSVYTLAYGGSILYAGGVFTLVGGVSGQGRLGLASWDVLSAWSLTPASNVSGDAVNALAADADNVYIGGRFDAVAGVVCNNYYRQAAE